MSSPGNPGPLPAAVYPVPPPLAKLPWSQTTDGQLTYLTNPSYNFLLQLWAGIQGGGGIVPSILSLTIPVAGSITAFNLVFINGVGQAAAPSLTVIADGQALVGFATTTGSVGTSINVQPFGLVTNSAWTWTPGGVVWCGAGGVPTQTAPTGAGNWVRRVGVAVSATSVMIGIGEVVELT